MISPWAFVSSIWVVVAKVHREVGERHAPIALVGVELASRKLIEIGVPELLNIRRPPHPTGEQTLLVCIDAENLIACHLALGWRTPDRIVDLMVEFRVITNGIRNGVIGGLGGALMWFDKRTAGAFATGSSPGELRTRLAAVVELYRAMWPRLDIARAIHRGRFMRAVARIEAASVPIDLHALVALQEHWRAVREMAWASRHVQALKAPKALLIGFDPSLLSVGRDGRNRVSLRPFTSVTGRNQPSAKRSVCTGVQF